MISHNACKKKHNCTTFPSTYSYYTLECSFYGGSCRPTCGLDELEKRTVEVFVSRPLQSEPPRQKDQNMTYLALLSGSSRFARAAAKPWKESNSFDSHLPANGFLARISLILSN